MSIPIEQHQAEIQHNLEVWKAKPVLRKVYAHFYERILGLMDQAISGRIVEVGSGLGGLKRYVPEVISTDLFPNPWIDLVCDGYELPFQGQTISHLVLFDVFHHLEAPRAFLREAHRVLVPNGRIVLCDPYISWSSRLVYGLFHHEPVWPEEPVTTADSLARPRRYYAAQGNATEMFFRGDRNWLRGWMVFHCEAMASFSYLFSGGFSKPALYPASWLPALKKMDAQLSFWPQLFGARCLIGLQREACAIGTNC